MEKIRVGVIGANPSWGWAISAHLPALQALPQFEVSAVSSRSMERARQTAERFGVAAAFDDPAALAAHPDVDVVAVCVRVPAHDELVRTAIEAGKHVYCEWPLARDSTEATGLLEAAQRRGIRHGIGLQARFAPAVQRARDLVTDGYVGEVNSVAVRTAAISHGPATPEALAYLYDDRNGAGALDIPGGHTIDAMRFIVGDDVSAVRAASAIRHPEIAIAETGRPIPNDTADDIVVAATLRCGALASIHVQAGAPSTAHSLIEITGDNGVIVVASAHNPLDGPAQPNLGTQISELALWGAQGGAPLSRIALSNGVPGLQPGTPPFNVAATYAAFGNDIASGTADVPDFSTAVSLHRVIEAIEESARTGLEVAPKQ